MARKRGMEDPFNDISRYSARYKRQARRAPKLDARPYVYEFFPTELYPTIGKDQDADVTVAATTKTKRLLFSSLDTLNPLDDLPSEEEGEGKEDGKDGDKKGDDEDAVADDAEDEEPDDFDDDDEVCVWSWTMSATWVVFEEPKMARYEEGKSRWSLRC